MGKNEAVTGEPVRVVVVDDMNDSRGTLAEFLELTPGIKVVGCSREPADAVQVVQATRPDLIVLDIDFDWGVSGVDLLAALVDARPASKVVVLSSYDDPKLERQVLDLGGYVFILKQNIREIVEEVRAVAQDIAAGRAD
jgi:DNA-binding NarL/FixJ family response regulator